MIEQRSYRITGNRLQLVLDFFRVKSRALAAGLVFESTSSDGGLEFNLQGPSDLLDDFQDALFASVLLGRISETDVPKLNLKGFAK